MVRLWDLVACRDFLHKPGNRLHNISLKMAWSEQPKFALGITICLLILCNVSQTPDSVCGTPHEAHGLACHVFCLLSPGLTTLTMCCVMLWMPWLPTLSIKSQQDHDHLIWHGDHPVMHPQSLKQPIMIFMGNEGKFNVMLLCTYHTIWGKVWLSWVLSSLNPARQSLAGHSQSLYRWFYNDI